MPPAGLVAGLIAGGFLILFWITRKDSRMPDQPKPTAPPEPKSTHKLPACEPPDDGLTQQYEWRGGHLYQKIREPDGSWVWRRDQWQVEHEGNRQRLLVAMSTRVATEAELEEFLQSGWEVLIMPNSTYRPEDKQKEYLHLLQKQVLIRQLHREKA